MLHMEYWSFSRVAVDRFVTCRGLGVTVARRRRSVVLIPADINNSLQRGC